MADVGRLRRADRGQLFLVAALALAVIFVTLAVLLNTAIYTGNIATRDPGPGTGEVVEYEQAAVSMADRTLADVNTYNNSSYDDLESTFREAVTIWSATANVHAATTLADAHVSTMSTLSGTKIAQESERNFTAADGNPNWTVANDSRVRAFSLTVDQDSLANDNLFENESEFAIEFDWGSEELTLFIYNGDTTVSDNVTVGLYDGKTEIESCSVSAERATVDLSDEQVAGNDCDALEALSDRLPNRYNTTFQSGNNAQGTYSLVVNRPRSELQTGADAAGAPYAAPALYSVELRVTYRSSVVYYRSEVRVAPGEIDA